MARPVSWLPRRHEIARSVARSVRSHYNRRDLELLFELQPRAAQKLIELLPSITSGTSGLVPREALAAFLDQVRDSDDVTSLLEEMRSRKTPRSRSKPRTMVLKDVAPVHLDGLPSSISLSPGRLEVSFQTVLELCEALCALSQVVEDPEFAARFEPKREPADRSAADDIAALFAELEAMEQKH